MATLQLVGKFGANILGGEVAGDAGQMDFLSDVWKATLHTGTWTPNVDTNEAFADATNELTTANGYTANGVTLTTKTVSYNATGGVTTYDCDDIVWTASGGTIGPFQWLAVHDDTVAVGPPIKPLIGYSDLGASTSILNGNVYTIATGANGLFQATVTGA